MKVKVETILQQMRMLYNGNNLFPYGSSKIYKHNRTSEGLDEYDRSFNSVFTHFSLFILDQGNISA